MNFEYLFQKISACVSQDKALTIEEWLLYLQEECGEVAACVATEKGLKNKKLKETSQEELVDVIITALAAYIFSGGTESHLNSYALKKVRKWENRLQSR